jgi:hypothetical protein
MCNANPRLAMNLERIRRSVLTIALLVVLTGCQHINHLREAQDAFNAAAQTENRARLGPLLGDPSKQADLDAQLQRPAEDVLAEANTVRSGYTAALLSLRQMSGKEKSALKADRLWGAAVTLQALAEWRLGKYDEALETAALAQQDAKDQLFPRDAATLAALPGLIKIDLAFEKIFSMSPSFTNDSQGSAFTNTTVLAANQVLLAEMRQRLVGADGGTAESSAVEDLRAARALAGSGHPVNIYLIQSQLAAYRNYQVAHFKTNGRNPGPEDPAKVEAQHNLHELIALLGELKAGPVTQRLAQAWKQNYGLVPTPR